MRVQYIRALIFSITITILTAFTVPLLSNTNSNPHTNNSDTTNTFLFDDQIEETNNLNKNIEPIEKEEQIIQSTQTQKQDKKKPNRNKISLMAEFGLGNLFSIYGSYKLGPLFAGIGCGYLYYDDEENETMVHLIEPAITVLKQINIINLRLRVGMLFINETRFGISGNAYSISPDIMLQLKGIYAGISLPIIIGKEGTGIEFGIGAGYNYTFEF